MLNRIISYSFYTLFFLTPLFWTSLNYELFEFNKMLLTYGLTTIIVGAWILKIVNRKSLIFNRTPLDIPLLLFLGANILSTIFSLDIHTSIWGYYSRSNGGLLSILSYLLLYWAYTSNMDLPKVLTTLKFGLASGFIISLWGILEHFGLSPSCVIIRGELNATCWVQDVQARVFATLGQPNWLAAYLAMLIFPALYFYLTAKTRFQLITYYLSLITFYLAFTFTYSRGPTLGLIAGMVVFIGLFILRSASWRREVTLKTIVDFIHPSFGGKEFSHSVRKVINQPQLKFFLLVLISFFTINIFFGSALTSFRLVSKFAPPPRPTISLPTSVTQLEAGGTESGQIRFIVWRGALDIFKHYPIFGSGVETFAQVYYQFRPKEHNLTSEWDFLYNKAHNEYLNYLATTGILGLGAYSIIIITFIIIIIRLQGEFQAPLILKKLRSKNLLPIALLASYISYLIYNFFLFSVVIIAIFFYLFPALAFVATESIRPLKLPQLITYHLSLITLIYRRPLYTKAAKAIIVISTLYLLFSIFQLWLSDTYFAKGQHASDLGNPGRAYNLLTIASELKRGEPFFKSELAYSAAQSAVALEKEDATLSAVLKDEAAKDMAEVLNTNPKNVSYLRTAIRVYFELSSLDQIYLKKTLEVLDKAISLAPTDPKLYYNKALVLLSINKNHEAVETLNKALQLKPNYLEAKTQLEEATTTGELQKR